ncbi:MAG: ubiquinol-cytochrome c reductase iron-sulfur subunit [Sulfuritalea sp.]|nr:ubiquinol-cytochrome c reductase iron-sulfur subunit [Sulfuritalea sp.]MDP1982658.1 ubiquinol-cytochrome c reductase iron-sulfur subunit [Sulfuritalea sp.]
MSKDPVADIDRRRLYLVGGLCALGAGLGVARYVVTRPQPPAGNPLPVDFGDLPPGRLLAVDWRGRTVWILRRGTDEIAALAGYESELTDPASEHSLQPPACRNPHRSLRPELFVAIGQCTHQGCPPVLRSGAGNRSEFLCPCHTSKFDLAGRVFRMGPAPANLVIPEYRLEGASRVVIGES